MDPALLSNTEFNGVVILGKQMMSFLDNNHIKICTDENFGSTSKKYLDVPATYGLRSCSAPPPEFGSHL